MVRFKVISLWLFIALICTATLSSVVNHLASAEVEKASQTHAAIEDRLKMHRNFVLALFHVQRGQRGYLLTGNESYLDPYYYGMENIPIMFQKLKAGSVVYGTAPLFEEIEGLLKTYLDGMVNTIDMYRRGELDVALEHVRTDQEKYLMDAIQALLHKAEATKMAFQKKTEAGLDATLDFQRKAENLSFIMLFLIGATLLWQVKSKLLSSVKALQSHLSSLDGDLAEMNQPLPESDLDAVRTELNSLIRRVWVKEMEVLESREREIRASQEHARRQEEFGSVLAHELRTPLNTLLGTIECEKADGNWKSDEPHKRIEMVAGSLLELVNSSLDYQRMSLGHYEIESEQFCVRTLLEDLKTAFSANAQTHCIDMSVSTTGLNHTLLESDVMKIKQVLMNLLSNAMKFTPANGRISIHARLDGEHLELAVADSGVGIPPDRLDLIFEPFQQADSGIRRKYGGTGIGLTLCRKIAECLQGTLTVESIFGEGATFTFRVPCKVVAGIVVGPTGIPVNPELAQDRLDLTGCTILLVEDHLLNAKINMKLLEKNFGCRVIHAPTGELALELVAQSPYFDLVLMDVNLGAGLSGLETTEAMRSMLENCPPVVALTAGVTSAQKQAVFDCGMVGLLEKPFTLSQAESILRQFCMVQEMTESVY